MRQNFIRVVVIAGLLIIVFIGGNYLEKKIIQIGNNSNILPMPITKKEPADIVKVVRIIDGDTIEIEGGKIVRYIGINTPESVDPRRKVQCFGKEASAKNKAYVLEKNVRLEKDVSETDKYGRLLRYVWLGDLMINEELVANGYAKVSTYPPDVKYVDRFLKAEKYAQENLVGLWKKCNNE